MGGQNESVLQEDSKNKTQSVLSPDVPPPSNIDIKGEYQPWQAHPQTQAIRQHLSGGQIHLHVDAEKLKVAVPVAEWYVILRSLRSLNPSVWIDTENKCSAHFKPYINNGTFEVSIELIPITIGVRFTEISKVAK